MTVTGIRKDYEGNLILVALDGEIILIKNIRTEFISNLKIKLIKNS